MNVYDHHSDRLLGLVTQARDVPTLREMLREMIRDVIREVITEILR